MDRAPNPPQLGQHQGFEVFPLLDLHAKIGNLAHAQKEARVAEMGSIVKGGNAKNIPFWLLPKQMLLKALPIACMV
jgi:hypothetical protein